MVFDADTALQRLRDGNRRFASGSTLHRFATDERAASIAAQEPLAIIVGCSDARVPVEAVFDVGVGELFVVRTAGHVLAEASLASVRYAIEKLGVGLVVVLGHEDCGAVTAALAGDAPDWLAPIVSHIDVSHIDVARAPEDADDVVLATAVDDHVRDTVVELRTFISGIRRSARVEGGAYKLASGEVHWLG
ncbi:MAG: carbonic anhydrase [Coriobacteriia bacterium]